MLQGRIPHPDKAVELPEQWIYWQEGMGGLGTVPNIGQLGWETYRTTTRLEVGDVYLGIPVQNTGDMTFAVDLHPFGVRPDGTKFPPTVYANQGYYLDPGGSVKLGVTFPAGVKGFWTLDLKLFVAGGVMLDEITVRMAIGVTPWIKILTPLVGAASPLIVIGGVVAAQQVLG